MLDLPPTAAVRGGCETGCIQGVIDVNASRCGGVDLETTPPDPPHVPLPPPPIAPQPHFQQVRRLPALPEVRKCAVSQLVPLSIYTTRSGAPRCQRTPNAATSSKAPEGEQVHGGGERART